MYIFRKIDTFSPYILITSIILIAYLNSVGNGFVMDDRYLVLKNSVINDNRGILKIFASDYWDGTGVGKSGLYRPLVILSFYIQYVIFNNMYFVYHLINILLHCINVLCFSLLLKKGFGIEGRVSYLSALLFALHPMQTEVVLSITGRAEIMAMSFMSVSMLFFYIF